MQAAEAEAHPALRRLDGGEGEALRRRRRGPSAMQGGLDGDRAEHLPRLPGPPFRRRRRWRDGGGGGRHARRDRRRRAGRAGAGARAWRATACAAWCSRPTTRSASAAARPASRAAAWRSSSGSARCRPSSPRAWPGPAGAASTRPRRCSASQMPHDERQKLPPMINLQQYYIEQYLLDAIDAAAGAPGRSTCAGAARSPASRRAPTASRLDGRNARGRLRAARPTGWSRCDGGQSFVRKALGLPLDGTAYEGRYVIIDIHLPSRPSDRAPRLVRPAVEPRLDRADAPPARRHLAHRLPAARRRGHRGGAAAGDACARVRAEHLEAIGEGHLPWRADLDSVYRAGAMTLQSYRHGRVLFAGNAAHCDADLRRARPELRLRRRRQPRLEARRGGARAGAAIALLDSYSRGAGFAAF